jgi:hypothetical protein
LPGHDKPANGRQAVDLSGTIKTHVTNALIKFDLHSKGELRLALDEWDFSAWE